jgi:uncharacterized protein
VTTLIDTGPIVALINRNDPNHVRCREAAKKLVQGVLVTTWPCFTEAMYLLRRAGGFPAQNALWSLLESGKLEIRDTSRKERGRMSELMATYHDLPMDLADASIVATAEQLLLTRVFSLDKDFHIYRLSSGDVLEVNP